MHLYGAFSFFGFQSLHIWCMLWEFLWGPHGNIGEAIILDRTKSMPVMSYTTQMVRDDSCTFLSPATGKM